MAVLDEKGRLFGRINVVDLAVVLVLLLVLGFGAQKFLFVNPEYQPEVETVRMTFFVEDVRQPTVEAVAVGDEVREEETNTYLGRVVEVESGPFRDLVPTAQGEMREAEVPGHYSLTLVLEGDAQITDDHIAMAGQQVRIGTTLKVRSQTYEVEGVVFDLEVRD